MRAPRGTQKGPMQMVVMVMRGRGSCVGGGRGRGEVREVLSARARPRFREWLRWHDMNIEEVRHV